MFACSSCRSVVVGCELASFMLDNSAGALVMVDEAGAFLRSWTPPSQMPSFSIGFTVALLSSPGSSFGFTVALSSPGSSLGCSAPLSMSPTDPFLCEVRMECLLEPNQKASPSSMMAPKPAPTPIPTLAPVLRPEGCPVLGSGVMVDAAEVVLEVTETVVEDELARPVSIDSVAVSGPAPEAALAKELVA